MESLKEELESKIRTGSSNGHLKGEKTENEVEAILKKRKGAETVPELKIDTALMSKRLAKS